MDFKMLLPLLVVIIASLSAEYMPKFKTWFGAQSSGRRFLFMLVLSLATAVGYALYGLEPGQWGQAVLSAAMLWLSNQGVHMVTRFVTDRKEIADFEKFVSELDDGFPR